MDYRFRGYDAVGSKGWVYGDLVHNLKVTKDKDVPRVMVGGYEVHPDSVGLASGVKDKNGREIYVGDIVRIRDRDFDESYDSTVRFCYGVICIDSPFGNITSLTFFVTIHDGVQLEDDEYEIEVVGNAFEEQFKK
jgi:hypothetical protein